MLFICCLGVNYKLKNSRGDDMETTKKKLIHISIDEDLKKDAEQLFAELGMNMTTAITVFLKQSVTKLALPFKIERGNPATLQARKDAGDGNIHGGFSSADGCWRTFYTSQFKRDYKKAKKQGKDLAKLRKMLSLLQRQHK